MIKILIKYCVKEEVRNILIGFIFLFSSYSIVIWKLIDIYDVKKHATRINMVNPVLNATDYNVSFDVIIR